jgi:hypothetical protein
MNRILKGLAIGWLGLVPLAGVLADDAPAATAPKSVEASNPASKPPDDPKKEDKPTDPKPSESKPPDSKSPDSKPAEAKPAEEAKLPPGHSTHGEAFNEGPRQKAYLMNSTGKVHFPITAKSQESQAFFDQGIGQLHGFWYFEAERSFRQVAQLDPNCAMAYWGMAMANTNNKKRARGFIAEAVKRKDQAGEREKMYIDALDAFHKADDNKRKERAEAYT